MNKLRCATCKEYFDRSDPESIARGISNFCSTECMFQKGQKPKKKARKNKKNNELPPALRAEVLERDSSACRYCGKETNLNLHHVKYRSEGGPDEAANLLTLCWEHHALIHSDKGVYQPACLSLLAYIQETGSKTARVQSFLLAS